VSETSRICAACWRVIRVGKGDRKFICLLSEVLKKSYLDNSIRFAHSSSNFH